MKHLLLLILLLLPISGEASSITLRTTLTKDSLEVTALHSLEADTYQMNAVLVSEFFTRISSFFLERNCSIQHRVVWRRPPPGQYVVEVTVLNRKGEVVQSGFTQLFVS